MKKIFYFILFFNIMISCQQFKSSSYTEGDIYIKLIDVNNILYGLSESEIEKFKKNISTIELNEYSDSEQKMMEYHRILINNDLYNNPHFKLKINSGKIINVYSNNHEYSKLKKELDSFDRDKQKIRVKFQGSKISDGIKDSDGIFNQAIYIAEKIVSVEKVKGETDWAK